MKYHGGGKGTGHCSLPVSPNPKSQRNMHPLLLLVLHAVCVAGLAAPSMPNVVMVCASILCASVCVCEIGAAPLPWGKPSRLCAKSSGGARHLTTVTTAPGVHSPAQGSLIMVSDHRLCLFAAICGRPWVWGRRLRWESQREDRPCMGAGSSS